MQFKQVIKNVLPAALFHILRDAPSRLRGLFVRPPAGRGPIPPLHLMFDGPRDFELFLRMGEETLGFYKNRVGLTSTDSVLDIGCGIGRRTVPLLDYLEERALYVGMEIDRRGIDWLCRNVTSKNPRFVFIHQDIYNKFYNPKGALIASKLVLPFPNASFDLVALWSVFTHMYPKDIAHYLAEISRVLKPGGKVVASYYLYNDDILRGPSGVDVQSYFAFELPDCRTSNPNNPEDAIAVKDSWLTDVYRKKGLQPVPIMYGGWSGHSQPADLAMTNLQDIVIAAKA
jgi:SAM-dependent methyltransferase